jgi:hypothetical protein
MKLKFKGLLHDIGSLYPQNFNLLCSLSIREKKSAEQKANILFYCLYSKVLPQTCNWRNLKSGTANWNYFGRSFCHSKRIIYGEISGTSQSRIKNTSALECYC